MSRNFNVSRRYGQIIVTLVAVLFVGGCRDRSAADGKVDQESEASFSEQLAHGRAGQTDRIALFDLQTEDSMLKALSDQDQWLGTLLIDAGVVTDQGAESIAALPQLWHLRLRLSPVTDRGLKAIAGCRSIQILNLPQCDASAAGVAELARLPDLRNLRLGGAQLGADTAGAVASIRSLRNVHLIGVPVDDEGLQRIVLLPKLQSLYLDDSEVTQAAWDWLFETHPDLHVHVNQGHLDHAEKDQDHQ